jgi:ArsR family transcriptional regulator
MEPIYELQAETLRTLAHPRRLEILHALAEEPSSVGSLARRLGLSQPNVSQHLSLMRGGGVVVAERDGREVRYRLADEDVLHACALMRRALQRRLMRLASATAGQDPAARTTPVFDATPVFEGANSDGAAAFAGPVLRHR